jgi:hypothetical protein
METGWPIRIGDRSIFLKCEKGVLNSVSITFHDVGIAEAPTITTDARREIATKLRFGGRHVLLAERDLRAWQSILAPFAVVDIDFDEWKIEWHAETPDEKKAITVHNFEQHAPRALVRGFDNFDIFAKAFLVVERGYGITDRMAFYLDARKFLDANRPIDAYNSFYLFFESNYDVPFRTRDAVKKLASVQEFVDALLRVSDEFRRDTRDSGVTFSALEADRLDIAQLIKQIVELRGFLRHNSLSNPDRWEPSKQDKFGREARFIGLVARYVAHPETLALVFDVGIAGEFMRQTKEIGCMTDILVTASVREADNIHDRQIKMSFPTRTPGASLAKSVLERCLEVLNDKAPTSEIIAIRARVLPNGPELFRYEIGPTLER